MRIFLVFFAFMFEGISSYKDPFFGKFTPKEQCIYVCQEDKLPDIYPQIQVKNAKMQFCRTGCLLFDIRFGGGLDVNPSLRRCQIGCEQAFQYIPVVDMCKVGCEKMASKVQNRIQNILVMTPQERSKHEEIGLGVPEIDLLETDLLPDPSIKNQLEVGFNVDYKIPETHIRTMPIEDKNQHTNLVQVKSKDTGDWLDCASKNSGIPKWVLLSTMLGAIMVAIWLTLSMESRRSQEDECDDELVEIPNEKNAENFITDIPLLANDVFTVIPQDDGVDVKFMPPPTYSEVNEMENSELPNYSEAVGNQSREEKA